MKHPARRLQQLRVVESREGAFTLVEIVVVLLMLVAISALVMRTGMSTRRAADTTAAKAAGAAYHDAIEAFSRDHGGRTPSWGSVDWPSTRATNSGVGAARTPYAWGPANEGSRGRPYLEHLPEAVDGGVVALAPATSTAHSTQSRIAYQQRSSTSYDLLVQRWGGSAWVTVCAHGNGPTARSRPC